MAFVPNQWCTTYQKQPKDINKRKEERNSYYSTSEWKNLRGLKLKSMPFCEVCLNKKVQQFRPATQVHHLVSFLDGITDTQKLELFSNFNNLCSICGDCHSTYHRYCQLKGLKVNHTIQEIATIVGKHTEF